MTYTEDIIDELIKRTGKERHVIEEIIKLHATYIKHLSIEEPEVFNMNLPYLCSLSFNYLLGINKKPNNRITSDHRKLKKKHKTLAKRLKQDKKNINYITPQILAYKMREEVDYVEGFYSFKKYNEEYTEKFNTLAQEYFSK